MLDWFFSDPLPSGTQAPDFRLTDQSGQNWSLTSLRGRYVVLIFYPGDSTPGCTKQLCEFRDSWTSAKSKNVQVFGMNPGDARSHNSFANKYQFPFPLLIDSGKKVADAYRSGGLIVRRTVYLIGPDGKIVFSKRGMPSPSEVLSYVK